MKKYNQSVFDELLRIMPSMYVTIDEDKVGAILQKIWRDSSAGGKISCDKLSSVEKEMLVKNNIAKESSGKISLTDKGIKMINILILGDSRSIFADNSKELTYSEALSNIKKKAKSRIRAKTSEVQEEDSCKTYSDLYWRAFL